LNERAKSHYQEYKSLSKETAMSCRARNTVFDIEHSESKNILAMAEKCRTLRSSEEINSIRLKINLLLAKVVHRNKKTIPNPG
jgi:hypothetical protein